MLLNLDKKTVALKIKIFVPVVAVLVIIMFILATTLFYFEAKSQSFSLVDKRMGRTYDIAKDFLDATVESDARAIRTVMSTLRHDDKFTALFASYDREAILEYTQPMFEAFRQNYNITHFYFTKPDRVNLLRVHAPQRYGDLINRITTLRAERTDNISYGIELGILGTLTLRIVSPWHEPETGKLIGYIEIGIEIDHVVEQLKQVLNLIATNVAISKEYLDKEKWQDGMQTLNRDASWDRFNTLVTGGQSETLPKVVEDYLKGAKRENKGKSVSLEEGKRRYWLMVLPIVDVRGYEVAHILLLSDESDEMSLAERTIAIVGIGIFVFGVLLIGFFYWLTNQVGQRLEQDENKLQQLASCDSLTGLYTRRIFDESIRTEIERSSRFGHEVSLLLLDIDFFKKVNDTYGHQAGDKVLKALSQRISLEIRKVDLICRYGGEEIILILPETALAAAKEFAERLLKRVSSLSIDIDKNKQISITVSIGVASYPEHAQEEILLISAVDKALYKAKDEGRNRVCSASSE